MNYLTENSLWGGLTAKDISSNCIPDALLIYLTTRLPAPAAALAIYLWLYQARNGAVLVFTFRDLCIGVQESPDYESAVLPGAPLLFQREDELSQTMSTLAAHGIIEYDEEWEPYRENDTRACFTTAFCIRKED